jgi:hypothetical protein
MSFQNEFRHLTLSQALSVYEVATPDERAEVLEVELFRIEERTVTRRRGREQDAKPLEGPASRTRIACANRWHLLAGALGVVWSRSFTLTPAVKASTEYAGTSAGASF